MTTKLRVPVALLPGQIDSVPIGP